MRATSLSTLSAVTLAMIANAKAAIVAEVSRGGSSCPSLTFFCKDFGYQVWQISANGTRNLINQGAGAIDANSVSQGDKCLGLVGTKAIVNCIYDGVSDALKGAFEQAGDGELQVCRDNIPTKLYQCKEFSSFFTQKGLMTEDACAALSNNMRNLQNSCASFLTTAKANAILIGSLAAVGVALCAVAFAAYKCLEARNNRRQTVVVNHHPTSPFHGVSAV